MAIVACKAALHELTGEDGSVRLRVGGYCDDIADEYLTKTSGERWGEIADLIGVRKDYVRGVFGVDELLKGMDGAVGCVGSQERVLNADDFAGSAGGDFGCGCFILRPEDGGGDGS
jgi:hypothetical protein